MKQSRPLGVVYHGDFFMGLTLARKVHVGKRNAFR